MTSNPQAPVIQKIRLLNKFVSEGGCFVSAGPGTTPASSVLEKRDDELSVGLAGSASCGLPSQKLESYSEIENLCMHLSCSMEFNFCTSSGRHIDSCSKKEITVAATDQFWSSKLQEWLGT
jgi:hypothetical protein